ncbi:MAG: hypothetical protein JWQ74_964 [Marmoricola sp.]|nr:hypothetical protein [Marmoricola sp.]
MPTRSKLTSRGRIVLLVTLALLVGAAVTGVVVVRSVFGDHCRVGASGREIGLDRDEAERVTAAAAVAARKETSVTAAVARTTDLSTKDTAAVVAAVSGREHAALTCTRGGAHDAEPDALSDDGLTARAENVRTDMAGRFGRLPLGGFAPGGVTTGHMAGSAHYEGRAIDVFFRPISRTNKNDGWALAHYLVANAERLAISTVIFDGRIWTSRRGFQGWREYDIPANGRPASVVRILEHRDHVHVDVAD